jgi:hypothetical protein
MVYPLDPVPSTPPGMGSATVFYRLGRMYLAEGQDGAMSRKRYGGWFYPIYIIVYIYMIIYIIYMIIYKYMIIYI